MPGKCSFQDHWLRDEHYKNWLLKDKLGKHYARCGACGISLHLASMGETVLRKHILSARHKKRVKCLAQDCRARVTDFFSALSQDSSKQEKVTMPSTSVSSLRDCTRSLASSSGTPGSLSGKFIFHRLMWNVLEAVVSSCSGEKSRVVLIGILQVCRS